MLALDVSGLKMRFAGLAAPVLAIDRFHLPAGGRLAITGASGSGKSTFVNAITGLEDVRDGSISWSGTEITRLSAGKCDAFRARNIGLVMQDFHLFPGLSAFENVVLPIKLTRRLGLHERDRALYLLSVTGIARPQQKIETLSRGEMQRVAVARALLSRPGVIVADEPTASLDRQAGNEVAELLLQLSAEEGTTMIVVTHDTSLAERLDRRISLASGRIEDDSQEFAAQ
ncbi:MAG: ATP-binding cassette domain-containing protein [Rhizobium sp.]|nr:MAG: ATP-binding cassette domain-containing protein [Rhizobium sp.]